MITWIKNIFIPATTGQAYQLSDRTNVHAFEVLRLPPGSSGPSNVDDAIHTNVADVVELPFVGFPPASLAMQSPGSLTPFHNDTIADWLLDSPDVAAWYDASSFDETHGVWRDRTAHANDAIARYVQRHDHPVMSYLSGSIMSTVQFPKVTHGNHYTLVYIARYGGAPRHRIFNSTLRWFSGFHDGQTGVAYHGTWITARDNGIGSSSWIVGVDTPLALRINRQAIAPSSDLAVADVVNPTRFGINFVESSLQKFNSSWQCACCIIFSRVLLMHEIVELEDRLYRMYGRQSA